MTTATRPVPALARVFRHDVAGGTFADTAKVTSAAVRRSAASRPTFRSTDRREPAGRPIEDHRGLSVAAPAATAPWAEDLVEEYERWDGMA